MTNRNSTYYKRAENACITICSAIKNRSVAYTNFQSIDSALVTLSSFWFRPSLADKSAATVRKASSMEAQYIANFCSENKFYWDNSTCTTYEMEEILKTVIGKALFDFSCYTSQQEVKKEKMNKKSQATSKKIDGNAKDTTSVAKQPTTGSYTTLGPLSGNVPNLIGAVGKKIQLAVTNVYWITADKIGKNTPRVYITPLDNDGTSKASAQEVKIGSGNGYSDCTLYWVDQSEAADFLNTCLNKSIGKGKFNNIHVVASKVDANGYYKVQTDYGMAYIKASKLNEEVQPTSTTIFEMFDEQDVASYEAALYRD